ncbi:MAG TPA: cytochrome c peroxidase [Solimonas sp.]|nr:cytochrome c peroxidase [Solimonas sp.]
MRAALLRAALLGLLGGLAACKPAADTQPAPAEWSEAQQRLIRSLSLDALPPPPPSPGNRHADDPRAQQLGAKLFSDTRLSANGQVACASCHQPQQHFTDGRRRGRGIAEVARHTPGLAGTAWGQWYFWDGRADSLWAQALQPLQDAREHGLDRGQLVGALRRYYRDDYETLFGPLPAVADASGAARASANTGKAFEAFLRQQRPPRTRFDDYARQLGQAGSSAPTLTAEERAGLRLFIGKASCLRCHLGPLLTSHGFHNTGLPSQIDGQPDRGRADGIRRALADPYNCAGPYSDAAPDACPHLSYARPDAPELLAAFKVPSLRGVSQTAPYMHDGRFDTLEQVIDHYVRAANPDGDYGHTELLPLPLSPAERQSLVAFLKSL